MKRQKAGECESEEEFRETEKFDADQFSQGPYRNHRRLRRHFRRL